MKQFNRQLYNTYDTMGKNIAISFLTALGYRIENTDEAYGSHDFVVSKDGIEKKVEVECKTSWKGVAFPYNTHSVPYRKLCSNADIFIQVNASGDCLATCPMKDVKTSPVIRKNTIYTQNEAFFNVPVSKLTYYRYKNGNWIEMDDDQPNQIQ